MKKDPQGIDQQTLYDKNAAGRWPGTPVDGAFKNTSTMKPVPAPCDRPTQFQYSDNESASALGTDNYYEQTPDKWNNWVVPDDRGMHREATAGEGSPRGGLQFADASDKAGAKPDDLSGFVEIPYGTGAGFPQGPSTVWVSVDRADRGKSEV